QQEGSRRMLGEVQSVAARTSAGTALEAEARMEAPKMPGAQERAAALVETLLFKRSPSGSPATQPSPTETLLARGAGVECSPLSFPTSFPCGTAPSADAACAPGCTSFRGPWAATVNASLILMGRVFPSFRIAGKSCWMK